MAGEPLHTLASARTFNRHCPIVPADASTLELASALLRRLANPSQAAPAALAVLLRESALQGPGWTRQALPRLLAWLTQPCIVHQAPCPPSPPSAAATVQPPPPPPPRSLQSAEECAGDAALLSNAARAGGGGEVGVGGAGGLILQPRLLGMPTALQPQIRNLLKAIRRSPRLYDNLDEQGRIALKRAIAALPVPAPSQSAHAASAGGHRGAGGGNWGGEGGNASSNSLLGWRRGWVAAALHSSRMQYTRYGSRNSSSGVYGNKTCTAGDTSHRGPAEGPAPAAAVIAGWVEGGETVAVHGASSGGSSAGESLDDSSMFPEDSSSDGGGGWWLITQDATAAPGTPSQADDGGFDDGDSELAASDAHTPLGPRQRGDGGDPAQPPDAPAAAAPHAAAPASGAGTGSGVDGGPGDEGRRRRRRVSADMDEEDERTPGSPEDAAAAASSPVLHAAKPAAGEGRKRPRSPPPPAAAPPSRSPPLGVGGGAAGSRGGARAAAGRGAEDGGGDGAGGVVGGLKTLEAAWTELRGLLQDLTNTGADGEDSDAPPPPPPSAMPSSSSDPWRRLEALLEHCAAYDTSCNGAAPAAAVTPPLLAAPLPPDTVLHVVRQVLTPRLGGAAARLALRVVALPAVAAVERVLPKALLEALKVAAASHPRPLAEVVLAPVAARPGLTAGQAQLLLKAATVPGPVGGGGGGRGGGARHGPLPPLLQALVLRSAAEAGSEWGEPHVALVLGLVEAATAAAGTGQRAAAGHQAHAHGEPSVGGAAGLLDPATLLAVCRGVCAAARNPGLSRCVGLCRLMLLLVNKHAGSLGGGAGDGGMGLAVLQEMREAAAATSNFMTKPCLNKIQELLLHQQ
ncbi:hypothetical protein Agub_g4942 [Astrephomene gubernaculifera]|uniref:Fanconi Anaemia group E protein C-terminal domain-containing protein n=1 Tax=Astrephomene gubernaculifera TaxID=47775 RepID=A0AAD3DQ19_9CHLO|nr:hypothetical protein Agub_g4942 [Astrephomene gubernaculifera]